MRFSVVLDRKAVGSGWTKPSGDRDIRSVAAPRDQHPVHQKCIRRYPDRLRTKLRNPSPGSEPVTPSQSVSMSSKAPFNLQRHLVSRSTRRSPQEENEKEKEEPTVRISFLHRQVCCEPDFSPWRAIIRTSAPSGQCWEAGRSSYLPSLPRHDQTAVACLIVGSMCSWKRRNSVVEMTHSVLASHLGWSNYSTPIKTSPGTSGVIGVCPIVSPSADRRWPI